MGSLALACALIASCNRSHKRDETSRDSTEKYLHSQLLKPSNIGQESPKSAFVRDQYLPGIRRALGSLDGLEQGSIDTVPICAYVRPAGSFVQLDIVWLQRDQSNRIVEILDKDGAFARFTVPILGPDPQLDANYFRIDGVHILPGPPPATLPATKLKKYEVRALRPFDLSSVEVSFRAEGVQKPTTTIRAPLVPRPDEDSDSIGSRPSPENQNH